MPGLDGLEVCRRVRQTARDPYVYIILLTGKDQQQDIVRGLEAGADDYLKKPFEHAELRARIRAGQKVVEVHGEMSATREALRAQPGTDAVTGLPSRDSILQSLDREMERARRSGGALAVVRIALDVARPEDAILWRAAAAMGATLRPYDLLGRYGERDFLVLLPGCD